MRIPKSFPFFSVVLLLWGNVCVEVCGKWCKLVKVQLVRIGCLNCISGCGVGRKAPKVMGFCESSERCCFKYGDLLPTVLKVAMFNTQGQMVTSCASHIYTFDTTKCSIKTLVTLQSWLYWHLSCTEHWGKNTMQTGRLLSCTRPFARWCPWVGEGCSGKCERWKAGTRPLNIQRAFYKRTAQCHPLPLSVTKSTLKPTFHSLIHSSDPDALSPFWVFP